MKVTKYEWKNIWKNEKIKKISVWEIQRERETDRQMGKLELWRDLGNEKKPREVNYMLDRYIAKELNVLRTK